MGGHIAARRCIRQTAGMSDPNALFIPTEDDADEGAMVESALRCVEAFTDRFNARDLHGMDALLHFPHVILSGENLVIWDGPGQLPVSFFDDLSASTAGAVVPTMTSGRFLSALARFTSSSNTRATGQTGQ